MEKKNLSGAEINDAFTCLKAQMERVNPLSQSAWQHLKDQNSLHFFRKKSLMVSQEQLPKLTGFIVRGAAKSYYVAPADGRQTVTRLYLSHSFCGPVNFVLGMPSIENIEFVADSWLLCMTFSAVQEMYTLYPEHDRIYRLMVEYYGRMQEEKVRDLQLLTVGQRLEKFMDLTPHYFNHFSVGDIASYLGTERETLTRLRSKLHDKNKRPGLVKGVTQEANL